MDIADQRVRDIMIPLPDDYLKTQPDAGPECLDVIIESATRVFR